jgi:hypothetical protein
VSSDPDQNKADLANHGTDLDRHQQEPITTPPHAKRNSIGTDLGVEDVAVGGEGLLEGRVVGGPGEAADEAAVLHIRRRHLPSN